MWEMLLSLSRINSIAVGAGISLVPSFCCRLSGPAMAAANHDAEEARAHPVALLSIAQKGVPTEDWAVLSR
jgi:hypothetical protein